MSAEASTSVEEAIATEPVAQAAEAENVQERQESPHEKRKRNDAEYNWAEMRRKMQERDTQIDALQQQLSKLSPRPETPKDDLEGLAKDDLLTVEQAQKLAAREARKIAEEIVKQREASTVEERLSLKYADYADVVTKENIEFLKETEPELAMSLYHNPDPHAQGVAAYKLLKKIGVKADKPNPEKERAIANSQKPVSVQAVTKQSAIGNAHLFENGLTKELKTSLWKEMQDAMKRA